MSNHAESSFDVIAILVDRITQSPYTDIAPLIYHAINNHIRENNRQDGGDRAVGRRMASMSNHVLIEILRRG
jgi:hypothetical protein